MVDEFQCLSRGEVWLMDWAPASLPNDGDTALVTFHCYPVLIISTDLQASNPHFPDVVVMPCNMVDESLPSQLYVTVTPSDENRLPYPVQVETFGFYTIPKTLLLQRIGRLTKAEMSLVGSKIRMVLELD
jgi:mRNA-degrading endonuclease toxin of MazEF toxin-antitoxin module